MTRVIKLVHSEVMHIVSVGPWPFVVGESGVYWIEHTEDEVIAHHSRRHAGLHSTRIILKLQGEIE